jgi:hypothetical protein
VAFRRIAEIDRRVPLKHDEELLLDMLRMTLASRAGRVAPEAGPRVGQPVRDRRERPAAAVAAVDELEFSGMEDCVSDT